MAAPLSPTPSAALNFSTPSGVLRHEPYDARKSAEYSENRTSRSNRSSGSAPDDGDSSPFLSHIKDDVTSPTGGRGPSPPKARPGSRIISGSELSPLKILQQQQHSQIQAHTQAQGQAQSHTRQSPEPVVEEATSPAKSSMPPPALPQSPRKSAPIKRFPVKVSAGIAGGPSPRRSLEERRGSVVERRPSVPETVRENEGLKHAIDIFEDDEVNAMHDDADADGDHHMSMAHDDYERDYNHHHGRGGGGDHMPEEEHSVADDTMISTFSAYTGVPNLTMLAQMRSDSPTKFSSAALGGATPRGPPPGARTGGGVGLDGGVTPSRTPRQNGGGGSYDPGSNSMTNLMDFTEQMRYGTYGAHPTPSRRGGPPPAATPQRSGNNNNNLVNLLDFDLPPAPTPRSVPSITPRELESLKSGFLSEISSLKASLSGKEAEAQSLKTAVGDAEKRVGECMEQLREVQGAQEALQAERDSWERRGREMESVLRKVKEEIVMGQREREELEFKLDEAEKRREAAEMMAQDAESKMAGMRAGKASAEAAAAASGGGASSSPVPSNREVEIAVERVARELHALYKSKHETKVAALKKSYESRWEKQVRKLQAQVDQLSHDNDELRHTNNTVMRGGVNPARLAEMEEERRAERARDAAQIRELQAEVEKVEAVLRTVQADNADLRVLLERERVEKGELVMLAEEMMNMQQSFVAVPEEPAPAPAPAPPPVVTAKTPNRRLSSTAASKTPGTTASGHTSTSNFRMSTIGLPGAGGGSNSTFRASGLRAPGTGLKSAVGSLSGIGRASHERTKSAAVMGGQYGGGSGMPRPGSGQGVRGGGIMSSIEKMGSYGGGYGRRGD
ncbi:hypothetical protein C8A05DRAFT_13948 [Staphylotrichum tortipilum]|uniref:Uncharacterized protein n=1 Tax=Staphylotrichum tortipilum TaxID=2831512 RepID=A0AAN6RVM9_9PEZI|nr:hypothetical protein C8A05DRAFT_13948 [Staphylotrichum longicolle]